MGRWMKPITTIGLGVLMLAAGCTVSVQPWTKQAPPARRPIRPRSHPGTATFPTAAAPAPLPQPNEGAAVLNQQL